MEGVRALVCGRSSLEQDFTEIYIYIYIYIDGSPKPESAG